MENVVVNIDDLAPSILVKVMESSISEDLLPQNVLEGVVYTINGVQKIGTLSLFGVRITEDGNTRITEDGKRRVLFNA